jgi:hypothetical protein
VKGPPQTVPAGKGPRGFPWWVLATLWALFVFGAYFSDIGRALPFLATIFSAGDRSSDLPVQPGVLAESMRIFLTALLVTGATWALGRRARGWLPLTIEDPWIGLGIDYGLGMVLLDFFWLGTGMTALWFGPLWTVVGVLLACLFLWDGAGVLQRAFRTKTLRFPSVPFHYWPLLLAGLFYWGYSLLQGLAPETFYDSLVYHLAVPQYWIFHHGLADFPTNFFSNYPFAGELYFLNGLVAQGTESAKMLHVASLGVLATFLAGWARQMAGAEAGWLAGGLTLTFPLLTNNVWTTQVEGLLSLVVALFLYALLRSTGGEGDQPAWALAAGCFAGLALSIKYTAILFVTGSLAVLSLQKPGLFKKKAWGPWAFLLSACLAVLGPWFLKNFAYTGNPFFPYLMSLFPGRHLLPAGYERLLLEQHSKVTTDLASWFLLPWKLTMDNPNSYNFCGPVWLAFLPALFLSPLRPPALKFLAWLTPLVLIGGLAVTHIFRFIAPDFILYYLLLSTVLAGARKAAGMMRTAAWTGALAAVLCFANLAAMSRYYYSCAGIWSGIETRAQYLSEGHGVVSPYYPMARWVSQNIPSQNRLLVVGDARGLYYDRPFLSNSVFDEQVLARLARTERGPEGILRRLKEMGVNDLAVNGLEGIRVTDTYDHYDLTPEQWDRLDEFFQRGTEVAYQENLQAVYRVKPILDPGEPSMEVPDLAGFFCGPALHYLFDMRKGDGPAAEKDLEGVLRLFPHSRFWQGQKSRLQGILKAPH